MKELKLVDKAQDDIKKLILEKKYDENGYLPSEGELCEMFGMSRSTVREAVRSLEVRGFLERVHGKGIRIADIGASVMTRDFVDMIEQQQIGLADILGVRRMIEVQAAGIAAQQADAAVIKEMKKQIELMKGLSSNVREYHDADFTFHRLIVSATKNKLLICIVNSYEKLLRDLIRESSRSDESLEKKFQYHEHIYQAIIDGDVEGAKNAMMEHLDATERLLQ